MTEYKQTLNLPKTSFPMKANLANREPGFLNNWQQTKLYEKIRKQNEALPKFILHDGPPYANGHLHCGHALNKILKDIVVKSKTLSGYDAPFVPGWDCHGLPIELNVEKKVGKAGQKVSRGEFRQKCRDYAKGQVDIQREEFQRLGIFGDWQNPYVTMDFQYEANIIRALAKIVDNGHLQQGFKPVHWCMDCGSALAEAEVEYEDKQSHSIDVAFVAIDAATMLDKFNVTGIDKTAIMPIWTTTPWTLPANEAVCLHPQIEYSLVEDKTSSRCFIVAKELVESVMARYQVSDFEILSTVTGSALDKQLLQHPFNDRQVPVVLGEHVTIDAGTGCVHTAPAHGPDDFIIGQQYELPLINPVLGNGCYQQDVEHFGDMHVLKANGAIREMLTELGVMLNDELLEHSYPHCWRHKTPVIFRATPQWFIAMDKKNLRQDCLKQIENVTWLPGWGQARISSMIENRPDWCISRQRSWGTPITLFVHKTSRELAPNTVELIEQVAERVEKQGIQAWFDLEPAELLGDKAEEYEKITDTMDVWLDSGVTHFCVLAQNAGLAYPADLYLEGSDQHRGWFNSSLTTSVAMHGKAPYKAVLTHGYTVDADGRKLSKSRGNYVSLDKLINQSGADILRLWVASTDYRNDVSISDEIIKRTADAYRRIRNTARFLLSNLFDFEPDNHCVAIDDMVELDKWAIDKARELETQIIDDYNQYNFHNIYQRLHNFCTVDMGSFYLDIIKDRQYTAKTDGIARRSCQTAMYHILQGFVRWLAPILSFTAEEIWQAMPQTEKESVFLSQWYSGWPELGEVDRAYWQRMLQLRDEVNKAIESKRQQGEIGSALAANVTLFADGQLYDDLNRLANELRFVLITSKAQVKPLDQAGDITRNESIANLAIEVSAISDTKCERCWHRLSDVGEDKMHPALCQRCIGNIEGDGEVRHFA